MYNFTEGYGTYLIPAVLIVIMFQTLLMVIGMISGEERDSGTIVRFASEGLSFGRIARVIISKTFVYCVLYTIFALFLLQYSYKTRNHQSLDTHINDMTNKTGAVPVTCWCMIYN